MLSGDRAALYDKRSMSGVAVDDDVLRAWEAAKDARDATWLVIYSVTHCSISSSKL